jgi:hypothetical protein
MVPLTAPYENNFALKQTDVYQSAKFSSLLTIIDFSIMNV